MSRRGKRILLITSSIAGLLAVFVFRRNLAAEATLVNYFGFLTKDLLVGTLTADSIRNIFIYPIIGLLYFDFFDIVNVLLVSILFIPVIQYCYMRSKTHAIIGTILLLGCLGMYVVSNLSFPILHNLQNTEKLNNLLNQLPIYKVLDDLAVFLFYSFGLFMTISMKRYNLFSGYTFTFGLLTNIVGLIYFPLGLILGEIQYLAIVLAAPFTVMWHANVALNNLKLKEG